MRKLYLVPVIHMSADMGSLAAALVEGASSHLGEELWHKHEETVSQFWDSIAHFFDSIEVTGLKVYQDGMVDVSDLLVILAKWGPCPPEGECAGDIDASGEVNVIDLLFVLSAWGPCE